MLSAYEPPPSVAFGGPGSKAFIVTLAQIGLGEDVLAAQLYAGGLFVLTPSVRGLAELPFAGGENR